MTWQHGRSVRASRGPGNAHGIAGGQGRSGRDVEDAATCVALLIGAAVGFVTASAIACVIARYLAFITH